MNVKYPAPSSLTSQYQLRLLATFRACYWNLSPPLVPIVSKIIVYTLLGCFLKIYFNITLPSMPISFKLFPNIKDLKLKFVYIYFEA
jgi:hypothetical protein